MLSLNSVMVGTMHVEAMAKFYEKVLGRPADIVEGVKLPHWPTRTILFPVNEPLERLVYTITTVITELMSKLLEDYWSRELFGNGSIVRYLYTQQDKVTFVAGEIELAN